MKHTMVHILVQKYITSLKQKCVVNDTLFWYTSGRMGGLDMKPVYWGFNNLKKEV